MNRGKITIVRNENGMYDAQTAGGYSVMGGNDARMLQAICRAMGYDAEIADAAY